LCRDCLLKHVIKGNVEWRVQMAGRRGRRRKQLLYDRKEKTKYCKLKEKALDRPLWRTRFGRSYGPVVRQTEWMVKLLYACIKFVKRLTVAFCFRNVFWRANVYSFVFMGTQHIKGVAYVVTSGPTNRKTVTKANRRGVAT
jgi:hypothetical protein